MIYYAFLIPLLYCTLTLLITSSYDFIWKNKLFIFPLKSFVLELIIQYFVFLLFLPDFFSKWKPTVEKANEYVILLPGYTETRFVFWKVIRRLKKERFNFVVIKYKPFFGSLVSQSNNLKITIDKILANNSDAEIFIVGHSMGGLIGRHYLENNNNKNISSLIMIATPHKGTYLAKMGIGRCSREITPESTFIKNLKKQPINKSINILSDGDNMICPRESAKYFDENIKIEAAPLHNSIIFSSQTIQIIINIIKNGGGLSENSKLGVRQ